MPIINLDIGMRGGINMDGDLVQACPAEQLGDRFGIDECSTGRSCLIDSEEPSFSGPGALGVAGENTSQNGAGIVALQRHIGLDHFPRPRVRFFGEEIVRNYRCTVTPRKPRIDRTE